MKNITRSSIYMPIAMMILTAAFAFPAAAQQQVRYNGTLQGSDSDIGSTSTTVTVLTVGTAIGGAPLGQFLLFTQTVTVDITNGHDTGTAGWFAANGDSISTSFAGSGEPTGTPGVFSITETHTITGGTGRFAGATGTFTVKRVASGVTFFTSGSFDGTITPPGAAK